LETTAITDFTAQARVAGLMSGSHFRLRAHTASAQVDGHCVTAPAADVPAPVRFHIGGDVGGQGWCRHPEEGYRIFHSMALRQPAFFIANGDLIYADGICPAHGPEGWRNVPGDFPAISDPAVDWHDAAVVREVFLAHWRYNRADDHLRQYLATTPVYAQWDDHEVANDFGAAWPDWPAASQRTGYPTVAREGKAAFLAYNPIDTEATDGLLYRKVRWGRELELFVLDGRSYRSRNDRVDGPGKTLLGKAQRAWLEDGLRRSTATWKVVSSNVPLAVPTGSRPDRFGRDGFANGVADDFSSRTGFEHELLGILAELDRARVRNLVFVVTDVHLAASLRHRIDPNGDGDPLVFHELVSGPLHAGRLPTLQQIDPTLSPVTLFSEGNLFNFGEVEILPGNAQVRSRLIYTVRDTDGNVRPGSRLELTADR
jgi:alkaline phosphatase D